MLWVGMGGHRSLLMGWSGYGCDLKENVGLCYEVNEFGLLTIRNYIG